MKIQASKTAKIAAILRLYNFACHKLHRARNRMDEPEIVRWKEVKMRYIQYDTPLNREYAKHGFHTQIILSKIKY